MSWPHSLSREFSFGILRLRLNGLVLLCVGVTVFTFIRLGLWQLGRADEKLQAQELYAEQQRENPLPIENLSLADAGADTTKLQNLHVSLYGSYDNDHSILVLAQFFDGQIGYEVLTPFRLQGSDRLVLVSRGWTSGILPPNTPPSLRPVAGPQKLTAQIYVPAPDERIIPSQIDASQWPLRIRSIEVPVLETVLQEPLFPYVVRLTEGQPGVLVRHWPVVNVDINQHLSYAFQWFLFAIITLLASLLFSSNLWALMRDPRG